MTKFGYKQTEEHKQKISEALRGYNRTEAHKRNISHSKLSYKNGMWRGDEAGYQAKHTWIRKHYIKNNKCENCNKYGRTDWANISGEYMRKRSDWAELCRSCHMKKDGNIYNFKGKKHEVHLYYEPL